MASVWAFLGISILVIVTPGPDTAVTVRNTLLGGGRAGLFTALGVALGQSVWALATSAGLVALLIASEPVFEALRWAGAAYLVWLGVQSLRAAWRPGGGAAAAQPAGTSRRLAPGVALRQGVISDLGNPKMAMFFGSLLPQFVPAGAPSFAALAGLGLLFAAMTFAWLAAYAALLARAGRWLGGSRAFRALEAAMGACLVALGLRLAVAQR